MRDYSGLSSLQKNKNKSVHQSKQTTRQIKTSRKEKRNIPAFSANTFNPSLSPTDTKSNIKALESPAFSKHSLAKSNLHTVKARSPSAFHLISDSFSGIV